MLCGVILSACNNKPPRMRNSTQLLYSRSTALNDS